MATEEKSNAKLKNIFSIVGFILLLLIGIWSAVQVISFIPRLFSSADVAPANGVEAITLGSRDIALRLTPASAQSGSEVVIDWARKGNNEGVVSFSYACTEGFHFEIEGSAVPCNAPFTLTPSTSSMTVVPLTKKASVGAPLAITYTNADNVSVRDTATLFVANSNPQADTTTTDTSTDDSDTPTTPAQQNNTTTKRTPIEPSNTTPKQTYTTPTTPAVQYVQVPRASNPYGVADIELQKIVTGAVAYNGVFEPKSTVSISERGAAKFTVRNAGTRETGLWYFNAHVPSQGGYSFTSSAQPSLMPGASAEILITFDQLMAGARTVTIQADPYNYVPESNENNNVLTKEMYVLNF